MRSLSYTVLGDGSSDRALVSALDWLLRVHLPENTVLERGQVADLRQLRTPPPLDDLSSRIRTAEEFYPCEVLFVHRDAEQRNGYAARRAEVENAIGLAGVNARCIPVVPVRMTEAWLLFDPPALRAAAGNPAGRMTLTLPTADRQESVHAKDVLSDRLRIASALTGRRAQRFSTSAATQRLAALIDDFSPLRRFTSFQDLEWDVMEFCTAWSQAEDT